LEGRQRGSPNYGERVQVVRFGTLVEKIKRSQMRGKKARDEKRKVNAKKRGVPRNERDSKS